MIAFLRPTYLLGLILLILSGCNEKIEKYSIMVFVDRETGIFRNVPFNGKHKHYLEEGDSRLLDTEDNVLQEGGYKDGLKVGMWDYWVNDTAIRIEWSGMIRRNDLVLSVPKDWKEIESEEFHFIASFSDEDSVVTRDFFFVLVQDSSVIDELEGNDLLDKYCRYVNHVMINEKKASVHASNLIELKSGKKFQLLRFVFQREDEILSAISLIGVHNSQIVECSILERHEDSKEALIEIWETARGLRIGGERFFSPFDIITTVNGVPVEN